MKEITGINPALLDILARLGQKQFELGYLWALALTFAEDPHTTEPTEQPASSLSQRQPPSLTPSTRAVHRIILAVDIEGSTKQVNSTKAQLRHAMYELVEEALRRAGIAETHRDPMVDRGDSLLVLIHPADDAPTSLILDTVVPTLTELLGSHNNNRPECGFRLRVVVHAGDVLWDGRGWFGESLDVAFRLLDAADVKKGLTQTTAPTVLVISDEIYRSVVCHGYEGIDPQSFHPISPVRATGRSHRGWLLYCMVPPCDIIPSQLGPQLA